MKKLIVWISLFCALLMPTSTFAQTCSGKDEVKVSNLNQIKGLVNVTKRTQANERGKPNAYTMLISKPKGHRRDRSGCCSFNSGWCGRFSNGMITVDENNNILSGNLTMFIGTIDGKKYLRFEGIKELPEVEQDL